MLLKLSITLYVLIVVTHLFVAVANFDLIIERARLKVRYNFIESVLQALVLGGTASLLTLAWA